MSSKNPQAKLTRNLSESGSSDDRHIRTSGIVSEDPCDARRLLDKNRTHSFILDLEQGSQEALKQRSVGKFDRLPRRELHSRERKEKERSVPDERAKLKLKQEKKSDHPVDESLQKEGSAVKVSSEEKSEKKPKIKSEKKTTGSTRDGKVTEGGAVEGDSKDAKKVKAGLMEIVKMEKDKFREKDKDKMKDKEKMKGEKTWVRSDFNKLLRPDSAGSSEDRSDKEPSLDGTKKRDKHSKEGLKRSKSHSEDKPADKLKSKPESEKGKADQDSQKFHKSSSSADKDPKKLKPTDKRTAEKSKARSKEEAKALLSLKTDKKVQSSDVKSAGGADVSKPETTKGKKKDGGIKEPKKASEETSQEKLDLKAAKKKVEKKDKVPEKKSDAQEEKPMQKEDKLEKSDKSVKPSRGEETKKQLLRDVSSESDPNLTTATTSFSEDTGDALSDVTPEPTEGDAESRPNEAPAIPAEADALLALMDVCTSAEARLPPGNLQEEVTPEAELQDADMKMKEAALTLLSMDPDSILPSGLIIQNTGEGSVLKLSDPQPMETSAAEDEQLCPVQIQAEPQTELGAAETSAASQPTAELVETVPDVEGMWKMTENMSLKHHRTNMS